MISGMGKSAREGRPETRATDRASTVTASTAIRIVVTVAFIVYPDSVLYMCCRTVSALSAARPACGRCGQMWNIVSSGRKADGFLSPSGPEEACPLRLCRWPRLLCAGSSLPIKEKHFFEYFLSVMNRFQGLACDYLFNPGAETEDNVRNELSIDKEFLGFKYWIVKRNEMLFSVFGKDLVWNKRNG